MYRQRGPPLYWGHGRQKALYTPTLLTGPGDIDPLACTFYTYIHFIHVNTCLHSCQRKRAALCGSETSLRSVKQQLVDLQSCRGLRSIIKGLYLYAYMKYIFIYIYIYIYIWWCLFCICPYVLSWEEHHGTVPPLRSWWVGPGELPHWALVGLLPGALKGPLPWTLEGPFPWALEGPSLGPLPGDLEGLLP